MRVPPFTDLPSLHGFVLLRGNGYQFPWPDLARAEGELITSIARLS